MTDLKYFEDKEFDKILDLIEKQMSALFVVGTFFRKK